MLIFKLVKDEYSDSKKMLFRKNKIQICNSINKEDSKVLQMLWTQQNTMINIKQPIIIKSSIKESIRKGGEILQILFIDKPCSKQSFYTDLHFVEQSFDVFGSSHHRVCPSLLTWKHIHTKCLWESSIFCCVFGKSWYLHVCRSTQKQLLHACPQQGY